MKNKTLLAVAALAVASLSMQAIAADGGNPKRGKHLYKKHCKSCHDAGTTELTPMSKTMSQWDRFFKRNKHDPAPFEALSEPQLLDINQFLYDHAMDSDQPATCG